MNTSTGGSAAATDGHTDAVGSRRGGAGGVANGGALAAFLGAGIGAFAMGLVVILNEVGLLSVPALYAPAGGVSSRTTLAVVLWLIAWAVLHHRWKDRHVDPRPVHATTVALILLGLALTFPPVWALL